MSFPTTPSPARADRRRERRRTMRRRAVVALVCVVVLAGAVVVLTKNGDERRPHLAIQHHVTTTTTTGPKTPSVEAGPFGVATIGQGITSLPVYAQAAATGKPIVTLHPVTSYGLPTTLAVDSRQAPVAGWVPVIVPLYKPNDTGGWVKATQVTLSQTTYLVKVSLSKHTITLYNAGQEVVTTAVIIGTPQTRTPLGRFYVTDPINCNKVQVAAYPLAKCAGAYGAFAIGTSGLSEALSSFQGTIPQIALHGTDLPFTELGKDLSNGCVRMPNNIVLQIASTIPLGTPVEIEA